MALYFMNQDLQIIFVTTRLITSSDFRGLSKIAEIQTNASIAILIKDIAFMKISVANTILKENILNMDKLCNQVPCVAEKRTLTRKELYEISSKTR